MKRIVILLAVFAVLCAVAAFAGTEAIQSDTQADVLNKLAVPTDGAVLVIQQGQTEAESSAKIEVKNSSGEVVATISANGTINIASGAHYQIDEVDMVAGSGDQTITGSLTIK